jgi:hypothetical protein
MFFGSFPFLLESWTPDKKKGERIHVWKDIISSNPEMAWAQF